MAPYGYRMVKGTRLSKKKHELYDDATLEARKMIVSRIIQRVDVIKGYQLKVTIYPESRAFFREAESWSGQVA